MVGENAIKALEVEFAKTLNKDLLLKELGKTLNIKSPQKNRTI